MSNPSPKAVMIPDFNPRACAVNPENAAVPPRRDGVDWV